MFRQSQLVMLHSAWLNFGACDMIIRPLMRSHRRWGPNDHPDSSCPEPFCGDASLKIFTQYPSQGQLSAGVVITKNTQKTLVGSMSKYTTLRSTRNTEETQRFFFPILISSYQKPLVARLREEIHDLSEGTSRWCVWAWAIPTIGLWRNLVICAKST